MNLSFHLIHHLRWLFFTGLLLSPFRLINWLKWGSIIKFSIQISFHILSTGEVLLDFATITYNLLDILMKKKGPIVPLSVACIMDRTPLRITDLLNSWRSWAKGMVLAASACVSFFLSCHVYSPPKSWQACERIFTAILSMMSAIQGL